MSIYTNISEYTKNNGKVQADISEFEKKRQAYNKEHSTLLSYGQFEVLCYLKKLKKRGVNMGKRKGCGK